MSIVPLDRVTICGTADQKDAVLDELQRLGCMHLIPLRSDSTQVPELVSREAREALRYLITSPIQRRQSQTGAEFDNDKLIRDILAIKERIAALKAERDNVQQAIDDLEPWGEFCLPADDTLSGQRFWFYVVPLRELPQLPGDQIRHIAATNQQFAYVVVLAPEPPAQWAQKPVELDRRPLSQLRDRLEAIEVELEELHWKRVTLTRWRTLLQHDLDAADDRTARMAAATGSWDANPLFAIQGWVPRSTAADVQTFAMRHQVAATVEPPGPHDQPPTLLQNPDRVAGAEGCVKFYITPNYYAWDPTAIVYFSFSLFFGMIVADAGYGLVMAGLLWFARRKLGCSRSGVRFRNLLIGIVSATIIYGVIVGSYFGLSPPSGTTLARLQVRVGGRPLMENQELMMALTVGIGVAHLVLATLVSAWHKRNAARAIGHLGWGMLILGAYLAGIGSMMSIPGLKQAGVAFCLVGAVAVLFFSSERPLATRSVSAHLDRLLDGAMQFTRVSGAFGDVLSYLRLFALGLAGAQLAMTFNGLAGNAHQVGGVGVLLAILLLVVGHGINFLLGIIGGVVHGLRLNCIEFFNWSLTDEGYSFQPFRKKVE